MLEIVDKGPAGPATSLDEDATLGTICISSITPTSYTVTETAAPTGYGMTTSTNPQTAAVVGGSSCSSSPTTFTFLDPPLYELQVNFRDGGSGETKLTTGTEISCVPQGSATQLTADSTTPPTGWTGTNSASKTYLGEPAPRIIVCTINVDP